MTNEQLLIEFTVIANSGNMLTSYEMLKDLRKEYKKSDFYKKTKMSLRKAYKMFIDNELKQMILSLSNTKLLGQRLTDIINNIDPDTIQNLLNKVMGVFNIDELKNEKGELSSLLNDFKQVL